MEKTNKTLSDKIDEANWNYEDIWDWDKPAPEEVATKLFKEFIKELKEDLLDNVALYNMAQEKIMIELIDKLAGDKLI